jgi:phosphoserine phosphatase
MDRSRDALLELTRGWEASRVQRLVRETLQEVIDPLIYQEALDLFAAHRRAGRDLYLVSSAGEEVVQPLAEYLGVPYVIATRMAIDGDGRYAGSWSSTPTPTPRPTPSSEEAARRDIDLAAATPTRTR